MRLKEYNRRVQAKKDRVESDKNPFPRHYFYQSLPVREKKVVVYGRDVSIAFPGNDPFGDSINESPAIPLKRKSISHSKKKIARLLSQGHRKNSRAVIRAEREMEHRTSVSLTRSIREEQVRLLGENENDNG